MLKSSSVGRLTLMTGALLAAWGIPAAEANVAYTITLDTAPLIGHAAGPFSLDFQLTDGSGTGDGNNTATLSHFLFGSGSAVGSPTLTGAASGNLSAGVTLTDTGFLNEFTQGFTPGSRLSFTLDLTTNVDGLTPDEFSLAILDNTGAELPTLSFGSLGIDVFTLIDIDSAHPAVQTYASDATRSPAGGGSGIALAEPTATPVSSNVPLPGTLALMVTGLGVLGGWRKRRVRL
jgi:hypothetical protein